MVEQNKSMNFNMVIVGTLYIEFLAEFYEINRHLAESDYNTHYNLLMSAAAGTISSYTNNFNAIGLKTNAIVSNDNKIQRKWAEENNCSHLQSDEVIIKQVNELNPEVVWLEDRTFLTSAFIAKLRTNCQSVKVLFTFHCAPYDTNYANALKLFDFVITCTPGFIQNYEKQGIKSYLVYHGFDTQVLDHLPQNPVITENVIFSGSLYLGGGFHDQRKELIEQILKQNISVGIFGNLEACYKTQAKRIVYNSYQLLSFLKIAKLSFIKKLYSRFENFLHTPVKNYSGKLRKSTKHPVFGVEMFKLLQSAAITLNIHGEVAGNYAGNLRMFEATGVGTCLLTDNKQNMAELFDLEREVVVYENADDCINKINWLLANPEKCRQIAKAGQEKTFKVHTVKNRCIEISEIIKKHLI